MTTTTTRETSTAGSRPIPLDDPVTRHMRTDFARFRVGQTVGEALEALRASPPEGRILYFYVLDESWRLAGVVPTRRLLLSSPETRVDSLMVREVIAVPAVATVLDACEFFIQHRLLAFPVVDADHRMIGVVDVELYTDELADLDRNRQEDDLFQLVGVHLAEARKGSTLSAFRRRFPWLLCNVAGGLLAAFLTGLFEAELAKAVALALFIPVVLALAESVSIQSVSLALQGLRGRRPSPRMIVEALGTESLTGLLLGVACAVAVGLVAGLWLGQWRVVLCILAGVAGGVTAAAAIGVGVPNVLRYLRLEPQVAAGPIALATADMVTLLIYFSVARWLLSGGVGP